MSRALRVPRLGLHKASGQGIVRLNGRDHYLGTHGTPECQAEYNRLIAEYLAGQRISVRSQSGLTIAELALAYLQHAAGHYVKNGRETSEVGNIKLAIREARLLYGSTEVKDFGPKALKAVRGKFVEANLCRNEINRRTRLIVRMFKWAVAEELVPSSIYVALKTVEGLKKGRTSARESTKVLPVDDARVDAVRL